MSESEIQLLRTASFAAVGAAALLLQRLTPHARLRGSWRVNAGLWVVDVVALAAVCGTCAFSAARWAERERIGLFNQASVAGWAAVPVTIAVLDAVSYGWHCANHRVRILWRLHRVHHADPTFTVSTALRFHPGELALSLPLRLAAVVALGASVEAVLAFEVLFTFANLVEHGDIDLPARFERVLGLACVTPALHRRHHSATVPHRDRNFGTIFSIWDRMFGTYVANDSATRIDTGLVGIETPTLTAALLLPFRRDMP